MRAREGRRGPRPERRPEPRESFGLIGVIICVTWFCDAREAHARCTDLEGVPGARSIGSASASHCGKTSPGGVRLSRCLARPSKPPGAQQTNAPPHWDKTTEEEEQGYVHGIGCWLREIQARQAFGSPNTRKTRNPAFKLRQAEMWQRGERFLRTGLFTTKARRHEGQRRGSQRMSAPPSCLCVFVVQHHSTQPER